MSIKSVMPSNHLIFCRPLLLLPSIFPSIRVFSNESILHIRWPKYWLFDFSISPTNEYSGLIFFKIDWFDLLAVQGTLKSSPTPQFKSINSSVLSFLYSPTLTFIHDCWKNHSFDYTNIYQKSDMKWGKKKKSDSHIKRPFVALASFLFSLRFSLLKCTWWCLTLKVNVSSWECEVLTAIDNKILQKPS